MEFVPQPAVDVVVTRLEGCTLVVACASHATVGQLAADLLINTLALRRVGVLLTPHVVPCVGDDAVNDAPTGALATALEVFAAPVGGLAVVQQRSPAVRGAHRALATELAAWAARAGVSRVVALAGVDPRAGAHVPSLVGAAPFRYNVNAAWTNALPADWLALETDTLGGVPLPECRSPPWPLVQACTHAGMPAAALLLFATDGDNAASAAELASRCHQLLPGASSAGGGAPPNWRAPASWRVAFGAAAPDADALAIY
jgi:hypothetical protein